jgi:hypothetical protein
MAADPRFSRLSNWRLHVPPVLSYAAPGFSVYLLYMLDHRLKSASESFKPAEVGLRACQASNEFDADSRQQLLSLKVKWE